jgi:HEAT repeat protein
LESAGGADEARVRRHALASLGYSSSPQVVDLIESAFQREGVDWKVSALTAMGRSADERWEDFILRSMLDDNEKIRRAAVQSAGNLALKSARPVLLRMLAEEEDGDVTSAAIWSLSQIGGEDVRLYLQNLLDNVEDDEQAAFLEEALDNLAFTEDMASFDLLAFDADEIDELDLEE